MVNDDRGSAWLVRPVSTNTADFGVITSRSRASLRVFDDLRARVVALIGDAGQSLERLGLARTIAEAAARRDRGEFARR